MAAPVSSVGRTMAALRQLSTSEPEGLTTTVLAQRCDLPRPTMHRLLTALLDHGLVDRGPSGRWFLGPELFLLGQAAAHRYDDTRTAEPFVQELARATEESAFYSRRRGDETVCLIRVDGSFPLRSHVLYEGIRLPLGVASAGLAVLSFMPDREIDEYLERVDPSSTFGPAHEPQAIRERIARTRRDGYSVNPGLIVEGSWGMAAPVLDATQQPVGALTLTGVEHRFHPDRRPRLGSILRRAAHDLSLRLTHPARHPTERPPLG